jgi:hypothetical protein
MQIDITPETERLIREEISNGQVHTVDEIIRAGVEISRERRAPSIGTSPLDAKNLVDLFANSPSEVSISILTVIGTTAETSSFERLWPIPTFRQNSPNPFPTSGSRPFSGKLARTKSSSALSLLAKLIRELQN